MSAYHSEVKPTNLEPIPIEYFVISREVHPALDAGIEMTEEAER